VGVGERHGILFVQLDRDRSCRPKNIDGLRRAGIAGRPHSQPNSRYRCFLPDLTEFTRFVIERDPAIAALDKVFSTLLVSSERVNRAPWLQLECKAARSWRRAIAVRPDLGAMAERVGFEPTVPLRVHLISSQARSTGLRHLSAVAKAIAGERQRASYSAQRARRG
jgi:hypothetical protein